MTLREVLYNIASYVRINGGNGELLFEGYSTHVFTQNLLEDVLPATVVCITSEAEPTVLGYQAYIVIEVKLHE